jgi:hypothetical protein
MILGGRKAEMDSKHLWKWAAKIQIKLRRDIDFFKDKQTSSNSVLSEVS